MPPNLHVGSCPGCNHVCQISEWNSEGLRFYRGSKFPVFYWFLNGHYNSVALLRCLWYCYPRHCYTVRPKHDQISTAEHIGLVCPNNMTTIIDASHPSAVYITDSPKWAVRAACVLNDWNRLLFAGTMSATNMIKRSLRWLSYHTYTIARGVPVSAKADPIIYYIYSLR